MAQSTKVGDPVLFALADGPHRGELRPATVVRVFSPLCVNLQVLTDGPNDGDPYQNGIYWATSILYEHPENLADGQDNYWCWPSDLDD